MVSGKATACLDCAAVFKTKAAAQDRTRSEPDLGANTRLLTQSGALTVYAKDTTDVLSPMFKKDSATPVTVFENQRH